MSEAQYRVVHVEAANTWGEVAQSIVNIIQENLEWITQYTQDNNLHVVLPNGTGVRVDQFSLNTLAVMPGFNYTEARGKLDWSMNLNGIMIELDVIDDNSSINDIEKAVSLTRLSVMRAQKRA